MKLDDFKNKYQDVFEKIDLYKEKYQKVTFKNDVKAILLLFSILGLFVFGIGVIVNFVGFMLSKLLLKNVIIWSCLFMTSSVMTYALFNTKKSELELKLNKSLKGLLTKDFLTDLWSCSVLKNDTDLEQEFKYLIEELNSNENSFTYILSCLEGILDIIEDQSIKIKITDELSEIKADRKLMAKFSL